MSSQQDQTQPSYGIDDFEPYDKNPRTIDRPNMELLKESIRGFPGMLSLKPIIVMPKRQQRKSPARFTILAGEKRYLALKELGYTEIPKDWITIAVGLTKKQVEEVVIKDNTHYGEWDWGVYIQNWGGADHTAWGMSVPEWVTFSPELDPAANDKKVAAADMEKTEKEKISTELLVTCPACAHDFKIKKG